MTLTGVFGGVPSTVMGHTRPAIWWGAVMVVADGLGGHAFGEVASRLAVKKACGAIRNGLSKSPDADEEKIERLVSDAFTKASCKVIAEKIGERLFTATSMGKFPALDELVDDYWRLRLRRLMHAWKTHKMPTVVTHDLPDSVHVRVDEAEFQLTLINLMLNAIQACRPGGRVIALKGEDAANEAQEAAAAIALLGGGPANVKPVALPGVWSGHHLVVVDKVTRTPEAYPRRAGIHTKRPLH